MRGVTKYEDRWLETGDEVLKGEPSGPKPSDQGSTLIISEQAVATRARRYPNCKLKKCHGDEVVLSRPAPYTKKAQASGRPSRQVPDETGQGMI